MKDLKGNKAHHLLQRLVEEGEHESQDFKFTVNDPRKIARSVSAFSNCNGGRLLIGVDDNGLIKGVRNEEDIYVVESAATVFCDPPCTPHFTAYKAKGGATVIRADIDVASRRPVFVKEEGNKKRAYFRVDDENIVAHPLMVEVWKRTSDPDFTIVFDMDQRKTSILDMLAAQPLTPETLASKVILSAQRFEEVVISLYAMGLVEFKFINRKFHLVLTSSADD